MHCADDGDDGEKSFAETWQDYVNKKAAEDAEKAAEAARAEEEAKKQEAAQVEKEVCADMCSSVLV